MEKICRRQAIKLSGQAFLALTAAMPFMSCLNTNEVVSEPEANNKWQHFIDQVHQLSESQFSKDWDQLAYAKNVEELIHTLDIKEKKINDFIISYKNNRINFPEINTVHYEQNFMVSLLEFEPGEKIKLHNHPDMSGVIYCLEGRVNIQNYTLQKELSDSGKLLLKQESSKTFKPGVSGILTSSVGNIHSLQADKFSRLIDVFTPPYDDMRQRNSKFYKKHSEYYQGIRGLFEAEILTRAMRKSVN